MTAYHKPVLLDESVAALAIKSNGVYVDVTFGGGGHSRLILEQLGPNGRLIAFDQDPDAWRNAPEDPRLIPVKQNFKYLRNYLRLHGFPQVDGILADLGVSSHQLDVAERGFSIRFDGPLDMRMNQVGATDAAHILNTYTHGELARIFKMYGELAEAGKLAAEIVKRREITPFETTMQLRAVVTLVEKKGAKLLARVFQALRIEVNKELEVLEELLAQGLECLKPGGRFSVIAYHSLEDRLVKLFFRSGNLTGTIEKDFFGRDLSPIKPIVRKAIVPKADELEDNTRSRSAKLRIAEKL